MLQELIDLLKKSGVNSKKQVIEKLENLTINELHELSRDCQTKIAEKNCEHN